MSSRLPTIATLLLALVSVRATAQDTATKPAVEPKPIRVLLIDGQNNHKWQKTTPLLRAILENSGRFMVEVATSPAKTADISKFLPEFDGYDVVVSNYNGQVWPAQTKTAFDAFVKNGGGFVSVHAANNAFPRWAEYNQMIGLGGWGGRNEKSGPYVRWRQGKIVRDEGPGRGGSHGRQHAFALDSRNPEHPIMKGLPARWMHGQDELYDRLRGPAQNLTVLATAFSAKDTRGSGEHEPLLMTIDYGKGRVFHTALGHDIPAIHCVGFQTTLLRGTEWAATGAVTIPAPKDFPTAEEVSSRNPLDQGWVSMFDGKTLDGWTQKNGTAEYSVVDGTIRGVTAEGSPNSFLCSDRGYGDFELEFEVKVHNRLNSGVQIRSRSLKDYKNGRVHGPQVEIEAGPAEAGHIYSEGTGRGWLSSKRDLADETKRQAFNNGEWNRYRVIAEGDRIRTWVNDVPVGDITDAKSSKKGFIGLQVHSIPRGQGPWDVQWRNLRIREL